MKLKKIQVTLDVEVEADADLGALVEDVFNFFCEDPNDLFPAIKVVSGCDYRAEFS